MHESWKFITEFDNSDNLIKLLPTDSSYIKFLIKMVRDNNAETDYLETLENNLETDKDKLETLENNALSWYKNKHKLHDNYDNIYIYDILPYLMLYQQENYCDWFLFDEKFICELNITKKKRKRSFWAKLKRFFSKKKERDLLPFIIVLRREYDYSQSEAYIERKLELINNKPELTLIYSIYNQFYQLLSFSDKEFSKNIDAKDIIDEIEKETKKERIKLIKFHPIILLNIINSESYKKSIYGKLNINKNIFSVAEKIMEKKGKRLLVDYSFPITKIREDDVFITSSLADKIYIFFEKGIEYKKFICEPNDKYSNIPDGAFDYIQVLPNNYLVKILRNKLKPNGEFLLVRTEEEYKREKNLKEEFSFFRHDLQTAMNDSDIRLLKAYLNKLNLTVNQIANDNSIKNTIMELLAKCRDKLNNIAYMYNAVNTYIKALGVPNGSNVEAGDKSLRDFLGEFVKYESERDRRCKLTLNSKILQGNENIVCPFWCLRTMLLSIIDNAKRHGFCEDYECNNPEIGIIVEEKNDCYVLKICNNGKPIDISTEEYTTQGLFKGITGHTGIGGYQIYRYAKKYGGDVYAFASTEQWNTEIHLILKKR